MTENELKELTPEQLRDTLRIEEHKRAIAEMFGLEDERQNDD